VRPVLLSGLFLGAHFFFWITSLSSTSVLSSVVIVTTNPIFVGLASILFLKERLHWQLVVGIVLAAAGGGVIALLDKDASPGSLYGDLMSLCGAVMMSCYLLVGRRIRARIDVWSYVAMVYSVAAVFLIGIAALGGDRVLSYPPRTYVLFLLLALVPQLIGHSALNWALGHATATIIAVCILGEPIAACVIAYVFLGERFTISQALGGALILGGILVSLRQRDTKSASFKAISSGPEGP
jgi:drug/metabolite transporter (DMT)-like permease